MQRKENNPRCCLLSVLTSAPKTKNKEIKTDENRIENSTSSKRLIVNGIKYEITDGKACVVKIIEHENASNTITTLRIPSVVYGYTVTSISSQVCQDELMLREVFVPKTVTDISKDAFPENVKIIFGK